MDHPLRIPGPAIVGLADLFVGAPPPPKKPTIVVRVPPKAPPKAPAGRDFRVVKSPQKGRPFQAMVPQKGKSHEESIKKAQQVASRAASIAQAASGVAKKASAKIVKKTVVGAVAPKKAAGAHLHAVRLAQAAKDVAEKAKKLGTNAKTHQGIFTSGKQRQQQAVKIQKTILGPSGKPGVPVRVGADPDWLIGRLLDSYQIAIGAMLDVLGDDAIDPNAAPVDPNAAPVDPNAAPADPNAADPYAADAALDPADPTYGLGPPPATAPPFVAGADFMPGSNYPLDAVLSFPQEDPADPRSGLPVGAVLYDPKSKPWGWQAVGSYTRFFPSADKSDGHGPSGFQWGGGNKGIMDGWYWWYHGAQSGTEYKHENAGNMLSRPGVRFDASNIASASGGGGYGAGPESMKRRAEESSAQGWGPLIGNPNDPDFKNLRYDTAGDRWFWFYDEAPGWAKALDPIVGDGMRLQKAILDYQTQLTAAKADALQAAMQDKADQKEAADLARQQARQDAQSALQQQQQQSQQQQAEAAAESQKKVAEMQQETQANALLLQQAQLQLTQASQAPEGYDEGGYDEGGYEDDSPQMDTSEWADEGGYDDTALGAVQAAAAGQRALLAARKIQKTAPRLAQAVARAGQKAVAASRAPAAAARPQVRPLRRPAPARPVRARVGEEAQDVYASLADAAASEANLVYQIQDLMSQLPQDLPLVARGQKIIDQLQMLFGAPIENILSGAQEPLAGVQGMAETLDRLTGQMNDPKVPIGAWVANVSAYLRVHPPAGAEDGSLPMDDGSGGYTDDGSGGGYYPPEEPVQAPSRGAGHFG